MQKHVLDLPLHPSLTHPITGQPLRALYVDSKGRARYPIMGGSQDPNPAPDPTPPADPAPPAPTPKPPADPAPKPPADPGFPENTPVAQMTIEQQAAYWRHNARKHEERATEYRTAAGGKTAQEVQAELEAAATARREQMSEHEKALEDAKRTTREETSRESGTKAARVALEFALGHDATDPDHDHSELLETLDLSKVLTASNEVDTAKVRALATKIAPAGKGGERRIRDFGAGDRKVDKTSGVAAGRSLFKERRGESKPTTTSS